MGDVRRGPSGTGEFSEVGYLPMMYHLELSYGLVLGVRQHLELHSLHSPHLVDEVAGLA